MPSSRSNPNATLRLEAYCYQTVNDSETIRFYVSHKMEIWTLLRKGTRYPSAFCHRLTCCVVVKHKITLTECRKNKAEEPLKVTSTSLPRVRDPLEVTSTDRQQVTPADRKSKTALAIFELRAKVSRPNYPSPEIFDEEAPKNELPTLQCIRAIMHGLHSDESVWTINREAYVRPIPI